MPAYKQTNDLERQAMRMQARNTAVRGVMVQPKKKNGLMARVKSMLGLR